MQVAFKYRETTAYDGMEVEPLHVWHSTEELRFVSVDSISYHCSFLLKATLKSYSTEISPQRAS